MPSLSTVLLEGCPTAPMASPSLFPPAILAAFIALIGNFLIQEWLHRRVRATEELKNHLYNYLELTLDYWINEDSDKSKHSNLEIQMMAKQRIISAEFSNLSKRYRRVRFLQPGRWKTLGKTKEVRQKLWDTATGGCFQQRQEWKTDPERALSTARLVSRIVKYID